MEEPVLHMKRWDSLQNPLWFMMIHGGFMICNYHVATVGRRSGAIPSRSEEITMNAQENQHPPAVAGRGRRTVRGGLVAVIVGVLAGGALATFEPAVAQGPPGGPGGGFRGGPGGGPGARPFPPPRDGGRSWMPPPGSRGGWGHHPPRDYGRRWSDHRHYRGRVWPSVWLSFPFYYAPWPSPYPYYGYEPYYQYELYYRYEPYTEEPWAWPSADGWNSK